MRKGDICEGYVEKIDFPNKGYVWVDEDGTKTRVIVKNAVPGQKVRFAVNKNAKTNVKEDCLKFSKIHLLKKSVMKREKSVNILENAAVVYIRAWSIASS